MRHTDLPMPAGINLEALRRMRVPVLAYHAANLAGPDNPRDDQSAFAADLDALHSAGWRVVPLRWVVEQYLGLVQRDLTRCVALSCDDGTDLDWRGVDWPGIDHKPGMREILLKFRRRHGGDAQPDLHLSCFVIASQQARQRMDATCLLGQGWMGDDWWQAAQRSQLLSIECHSWDHNHACLEDSGSDSWEADHSNGVMPVEVECNAKTRPEMPHGNFQCVDTPDRARFEIDQAVDYINAKIRPDACRLFCYPYGHVPPYLRDDYFSANAERLGLLGAFGDATGPITPSSERWNLPRYICGSHWKSFEDLLALLERSCD